ncbi:hypothetical protein COU57_06185 [Candidatus Pacearchaeota archaeon CG10_big_fil_rev_8_21_14_0_10_32_14]|nr:MAG: hypothetical protein COU57_06185 [Candidatus Pacearchaeota archaeon CG10_big_fil_rev_8_21_14_0_10_32_14]
MEEEASYYSNPLGDIAIKVRDIEERSRIINERTLLLGKNIIEMRDNYNNEFMNMKKDLEKLKQEMKRISAFLEIASKEFSSFARKEDVAILAKQAKMFQPLEFVKKSELKQINHKE